MFGLCCRDPMAEEYGHQFNCHGLSKAPKAPAAPAPTPPPKMLLGCGILEIPRGMSSTLRQGGPNLKWKRARNDGRHLRHTLENALQTRFQQKTKHIQSEFSFVLVCSTGVGKKLGLKNPASYGLFWEPNTIRTLQISLNWKTMVKSHVSCSIQVCIFKASIFPLVLCQSQG